MIKKSDVLSMYRDTSIYDDLNLTLGDRAFLTGSRAYGTPREDSDIDMVVLVEKDVLDMLTAFGTDQSARNLLDGYSVIRFDKLNIIAFLERDKFETWKRVNEDLIKQAPVTRAQAAYALRKALEE